MLVIRACNALCHEKCFGEMEYLDSLGLVRLILLDDRICLRSSGEDTKGCWVGGQGPRLRYLDSSFRVVVPLWRLALTLVPRYLILCMSH